MKHSLLVLTLITCGCGAFRVLFPFPMQTSSQDFEIVGNRIQISVLFNKPPNLSSLVSQTNVILETEQQFNAPVTITAGGPADEIIITSVDEVGNLCDFDSDCSFCLRLLGSGSNPIRSSDGESLDGDSDGSPGGEYETCFVLIG